MKYSTLWIPLSFCNLVLKENYHREAQLYIGLKMMSGGQFLSTTSIRKQVLKKMDVSESKMYRLMNELQKRNWVGYNEDSQRYFVRGFSKLYQLENLEGKTGVYFRVEWLSSFRAFAAGASIGHLVHQQKRGGGSRSEKKGRSNHNSRLPQYKPVATNAVQKIFNLSYGTAYRLKRQANREGFIDIKRNGIPMNLTVKDLPRLKRYNRQKANKIFVVKGLLYIKAPDLVKPELFYKNIDRYSPDI